MGSATVEATIARFARIARGEIRRDHGADSCVASTWIAVQALRELGLNAVHREVVASVGNGVYAKLWRQHGPPKTREILDDWSDRLGSFVVGIGHDRHAGGIGGHLVCTIDNKYVVDASLDQAADEIHNLRIPAVVWFRIDQRGLPLGIIRHVSDNLFVEYVDRPVIVDYQSSPDWGKTDEVRTAVARIVEQCRA
jgi:hypothetical protein